MRERSGALVTGKFARETHLIVDGKLTGIEERVRWF